MKSFIEAAVIAALVATPFAAFAQSNQDSQPVTRAQVRAELVQLEKAGYNPSTMNTVDYPENLQAAEARVNGQNQVAQTSGYGAPAQGSSRSGSRTDSTVSSYSVPVVNYTHQ